MLWWDLSTCLSAAMAMRLCCLSFFLEMPVCRSASESLFSSSLSSPAAGFSSSCVQNDHVFVLASPEGTQTRES